MRPTPEQFELLKKNEVRFLVTETAFYLEIL